MSAPEHSSPAVPLTPEVIEQVLSTWSPAREDDPQILRRGLSVAIRSGMLHAYTYRHDLAFTIRGPQGDTVAVKRRCSATGGQRYRYLTAGQGTPAWCSPQLSGAQSEVWIEGELNGVAVAAALAGSQVGVQGVAGAGGRPHTDHLRAGPRPVYIYADPDEAGQRARARWQELAAQHGCVAHQLPADLFQVGDDPDMDACDALAALGQEALAVRLQAALEAPDTPDTEIYIDQESGYGVHGGRLVALRRRTTRQGETSTEQEVLAEFSALITEERHLHDGLNEPRTELVLTGSGRDGRPFPRRLTLAVDQFHAMAWPMALGGTAAVLHAGMGVRDRARVCIQMLSSARGVVQQRVFTHTGWHIEDGVPVYLTADAVIGPQGAVQGLTVQLDDRLQHLRLPAPPEGDHEMEAVLHALGVSGLAPPEVAVPALGALYRSPLGRSDHMVILIGSTGTGKTTFLALLMAHFGKGFNRTHLPSSWQSSANAVEQLAFFAKDVLLLVDDFKPGAGQPRQVGETLSRILQGVADGAGRATLTADRKARPNVFPRGTVITSAEEVPSGESNQARALLVPVTAPLLGRARERSKAYYSAEDLARQGVYAAAMAGYVRYIAQRYAQLRVGSDAHRQHVRSVSEVLRGPHGRTGVAAAEVSYGWRVWLSYAVHCGALDQASAEDQWRAVMEALRAVVDGQSEFQRSQNPVDRFLHVLSTLLMQGRVYLEDAETGGMPEANLAQSAGWRSEKTASEDGEVQERYRTLPGAHHVGWVGQADAQTWAYLMPDAIYQVTQQMCLQQQQPALPSPTTLWAMLRDTFHPRGLMRCAEERRGEGKIVRPTRKTRVYGVDGHPSLLNLAFPLERLLQRGGNRGNGGNDSEETACETTEKPFPLLSLFQ